MLPQEKKSIVQTPTDNIEAYTYYLKGRELFHRRFIKSLVIKRRGEMFVKAAELDPFMRALMPE